MHNAGQVADVLRCHDCFCADAWQPVTASMQTLFRQTGCCMTVLACISVYVSGMLTKLQYA